jgi:Na+/H+ antiporter NhaD/arsenite permease-like protein
MIVGAVFFYSFFAKAGARSLTLERVPILSWVPTILLLLMILGLAAASFLHAGISFLSGAIVMVLGIAGLGWYKFVRKESAKTPGSSSPPGLGHHPFPIGIFIVVGSLSEVGLLEDFSAILGVRSAATCPGLHRDRGHLHDPFGLRGQRSYIIIMLPVAAKLTGGLGIAPELYMFALLIGSCMGGNLTPFGASANVVATGMLKKQGYPNTFADWLKIGLPFTVLTTAAASGFVWLVWR